MEEWWKSRELKGFQVQSFSTSFFCSFEGNCLRASKYNLWHFLSGFVWVCAHVHQCVRKHKRDERQRWADGKVVLYTCIRVYVRGSFWYPSREKSVSYLSLCFKEGMKAIFKWHLQSRSTWTQSAPVRSKWTTGEFLWWPKLNANHTKHSHSHTSIRLPGNKNAETEQRRHLGWTSMSDEWLAGFQAAEVLKQAVRLFDSVARCCFFCRWLQVTHGSHPCHPFRPLGRLNVSCRASGRYMIMEKVGLIKNNELCGWSMP